MGDRCIMYVRGASASLYCHWVGGADGVRKILTEAAKSMRAGDPCYAQARLIGAACAALPGVLGVGLMPPIDVDGNLGEQSHGNAGIVLIDPNTGTIECVAGYLAGSDPLNLPSIEMANV